MSSKKDKENSKNTNSKKRDRPEAKEWQWEDTELADEETTSMLAQDVKQLLLTRGEEKTNLKGKKIDIIKYLKEKYTVDLDEPLSNLTVKELQAELRLRKLDDTQAKKDILVKRLKGEIESMAPPSKKAKRGRKAKALPKMYVVIYTPEAGDEEGAINPLALGVYKSESKAHEKGITRLMDDMEKKYGDKKQNKIEEWHEKLDKLQKKEFVKRLETANNACEDAYGGPDDSPFVVISESAVES